MEIGKLNVLAHQKGALPRQIDMCGLRGKWNCPERSFVKTAGIVVVRLVVEVNLTYVEIESKERECTPVTPIVLADVQALHHAHVKGVQHPEVVAGDRVRAGATSECARGGDEPIEVPYL